MRELRDSGDWLVRAPLATIVLDREAGEFFLRSKSSIFPGVLLADLFSVPEGPLREQVVHNIINVNGADHGRLRRLVNPALAPRAANGYRPVMREILAELWEPVAGAGRADLVGGDHPPLPGPRDRRGHGRAQRGCRSSPRLVDVDPAAVRPDCARGRGAARDDQRQGGGVLRMGAAVDRAPSGLPVGRPDLGPDRGGGGGGQALGRRAREPRPQHPGRRRRHEPESARARPAAALVAPRSVGRAAGGPRRARAARGRGVAALRADHAVHRAAAHRGAHLRRRHLSGEHRRLGLRVHGQPRPRCLPRRR